jgi:hypothetical protein
MNDQLKKADEINGGWGKDLVGLSHDLCGSAFSLISN